MRSRSGAIDTHDTALRSDDTLASYSSKGPTRYDLIMKPDLSAPGSHIRSAEAVDSYLSKTYPARHVSGDGANAVMQLSGTSMAAGFVSGAAALVLDARGSLSPRDTKTALQLTSTFMPTAGLVGAGAGTINALAAVELAETSEIPDSTTIAGEEVVASRHFSASIARLVALAQARGHRRAMRYETHGGTSRLGQARSFAGSASDGDTIVGKLSTIVWGGRQREHHRWGRRLDTIIWGVTVSGWRHDRLWGVNGSTIIWGVVD